MIIYYYILEFGALKFDILAYVLLHNIAFICATWDNVSFPVFSKLISFVFPLLVSSRISFFARVVLYIQASTLSEVDSLIIFFVYSSRHNKK